MKNRDSLDDLLAGAAVNPPAPSADFMARLQAQALHNLPKPVAPALRAAPATAPKVGFWDMILSALGGAVPASGVGAAAVMGVLIGYAQPDAILTLADSYGLAAASDGGIDLLPGIDALLTEE